MLYINPDAADQEIAVTLKEKWKDFATAPESYLLILTNTSGSGTYALIPVVVTDNDRYSVLRFSTDADDPGNASIELLQGGEFSYIIYGQTGTTNLDPEDSEVIGVFEVGTLYVAAASFSDFTDETVIPDTYVDQE